jgi:hypothetical protein
MAGFTTQDRESPLGGRNSRWSLFAQGSPGDQAKPGAWQLMILSHLSGPDGRCTGATDDEAFGMLGQWGAAASWVEGRKLAVLRELIRRRPDERNVGAATASGLPWDWDGHLAHEVALELRVSVPAARKLTWAAWALEARLPGVGRALDEGRLDLGRAKMVIEETDVLLEPAKLARAEEMILAGLDACATWTDLQRLAQRAVVTVDPDGARKRREQEEKEHARVRFWREAPPAPAPCSAPACPPTRPCKRTPASSSAPSNTGPPASSARSIFFGSPPTSTCSTSSRPTTVSPASRPKTPKPSARPVRMPGRPASRQRLTTRATAGATPLAMVPAMPARAATARRMAPARAEGRMAAGQTVTRSTTGLLAAAVLAIPSRPWRRRST